jgi:hypothetical protein
MTPYGAVYPPLGLITLAALTPPEYAVTVCDESAGETIDFDTAAEIVGVTGYLFQHDHLRGRRPPPAAGADRRPGRADRHPGAGGLPAPLRRPLRAGASGCGSKSRPGRSHRRRRASLVRCVSRWRRRRIGEQTCAADAATETNPESILLRRILAIACSGDYPGAGAW